MVYGNMNKTWAQQQWIGTKQKHALHTFYLYVEPSGTKWIMDDADCATLWLTNLHKYTCLISVRAKIYTYFQRHQLFPLCHVVFLQALWVTSFCDLKALLINGPDDFCLACIGGKVYRTGN